MPKSPPNTLTLKTSHGTGREYTLGLSTILDEFGQWRAHTRGYTDTHPGLARQIRHYLESADGRGSYFSDEEAFAELVRRAGEARFCLHCGLLMFRNEAKDDKPEWRTVFVHSDDPDQCFVRHGRPSEPVNDGHEVAEDEGKPSATPEPAAAQPAGIELRIVTGPGEELITTISNYQGPVPRKDEFLFHRAGPNVAMVKTVTYGLFDADWQPSRTPFVTIHI
jgi:hypothetical protein